MIDPARFSRSDGAWEGALLDAMKHDSPAPGSKAKTLAALGLGTSVAVASSVAGASAAAKTASTAAGTTSLGGTLGVASSGVTTTSTVALVKWLGAGLLVGGASVGVASLDASAPSAAPSAVLSLESPSVSVSIRPTSSPQSNAIEDASADTASRAQAVGAPLPVAAPPTQDAQPETSQSLRDEVAALDVVRRSLADGASDRAIALLVDYRIRFPKRQLDSEASLLEVEALMKLGRGSQARAAAQRFVDSNPSSPLIPRMRSVAQLAPVVPAASGAP